MKVWLHHPPRVLEIQGPKRVAQLLKELDLFPETVLVILKGDKDESDQLLPPDIRIEDHQNIEIRPVISGGTV
jgi:sulfur carrier protein ThiS